MTDFDANCRRCSRLAEFLDDAKQRHPSYFCRPVPAFGEAQPQLLVVGLAPGMHGANRTGRPFTGDHAGILLYQTLFDMGFATAAISTAADDDLQLRGARISNAVKCLPPANKPTPQEIRQCNVFLRAEMAALTRLRVVIALGRIAHDAVLEALSLKRASYPFGHAAEHALPRSRTLIASYHCSRYNTQTRRLTPPMFRAVFQRARELVDA
jgi:uracil-DNA glycosylase family 4